LTIVWKLNLRLKVDEPVEPKPVVVKDLSLPNANEQASAHDSEKPISSQESLSETIEQTAAQVEDSPVPGKSALFSALTSALAARQATGSSSVGPPQPSTREVPKKSVKPISGDDFLKEVKRAIARRDKTGHISERPKARKLVAKEEEKSTFQDELRKRVAQRALSHPAPAIGETCGSSEPPFTAQRVRTVIPPLGEESPQPSANPQIQREIAKLRRERKVGSLGGAEQA
jgi:hypothetical protein